MSIKSYLVFAFIAIFVVACTKDRMPSLIELDDELKRRIEGESPDGTTSYYILPDGSDLSEIPQDPKNVLTEKKIELGKMLFFETGLAEDAVHESGIGTYSCATCHIPEAAFRPGSFQGIADGGMSFGVNGENRVMNSADYDESELDVQSARPLSMINVAFVENTFWNGQFGAFGVNEGTEDVWDVDPGTARNHLGMSGIEVQNIQGLVDHRITINEEILERYGYKATVDEVFADVPVEERYTVATVSLAFSAYIRSIISSQAPFQRWLAGDNNALGEEEKKGGILFFGKANCSNCHYEKNLGSLEFHALGVNDMYQQPSYDAHPTDKRNFGRGGFTLNPEDNFKFKVPGLYNVGDADFYFHGASRTTLREVLDYKDIAEKENPNVPLEQMSEKFLPLGLTEEEKDQLEAFLRNALRDPDMNRFKPDYVLSGLCFPNNDPQSKIDLGCN
jgi:cytochrome c peroxidase